MVNRTYIGVCLLFLVVTLVVVGVCLFLFLPSGNDSGIVSTLGDSVFVGKSNKLISYEEKVKKTLIGYEQLSVKANVSKEVWRVNPKFVNDSGVLNDEPAEVLVNELVEEESFVNGEPIYENSAPIGIKYGDFEVDFDDSKACVVCGQKLYCLSKTDGWSPNRGIDYWCKNDEPVIRLGESYYVYDLVEKKELGRHSDVSIT